MVYQQQHEVASILEHIGELRKKIFLALGVFIIGVIGAHIFHKEIIAFLLKSAGGQQLIFLSPLEPLFFIFKIDCLAGIIFSFPAILWCLISYIAPALPKRISSLLVLFYIISTFLLITALSYAFLVTIPLSLKFLFSVAVDGIKNQFSAQSYVDFIIAQAIIITLIFQVPIFIIGGIYLNVFSAKIMAKKRQYIYLIVTIALAIITPTVDIFSLIIVLIPCLVIFEISLIGGRIAVARKMKNKAKNDIHQIDVN